MKTVFAIIRVPRSWSGDLGEAAVLDGAGDKHVGCGITDQGYIGFRAGNVSGYYHNDTRIPPSFGIKSTDQGWTAGAGISYRSRHGSVDIYHEHFTSIAYEEWKHKQNGHEYWKQSSHDRAYNRAITAVRHRMREYAVSGAPWGQNFVHDRLTGGEKFHYADYE